MSGGFQTVPDELRGAASMIGSAVGGVADLIWRGPSGDYGHPAVQTGWTQFIEDMKSAVQKLHDTANEHGEKLNSAASSYEHSDSTVGTALGGIGAGIEDASGPIAGGALGSAVGAAGTAEGGAGSVSGFIDPAVVYGQGSSIAQRLGGAADEGEVYY